MKILVVSERYWPEGSGGELATHLVLKLLKGEGFQIRVLTGTNNVDKVPGVEYFYEPLMSRKEKIFLWQNLYRLAKMERLRKLIEWSDVVYIPRFSFPIIPVAKKLKKKVVVHLHGYIPISYTATILAPYERHRHRITRDDIYLECIHNDVKRCLGVLALWWLPKLARKWIAEVDTIICVSKRHAQIMSEMAPELKDMIRIIYNPLPPMPKIEKKPAEIPTFLYVGGGSYIKGFYVLLKALQLLGQRTKAKFILAGNYSLSQLKTIETVKKRQGLDIEVLGRVSHDHLLRLHSKTWALLFPSIVEEPLPYAVVEAMAYGTLPIASKVGGVVEILDGTPAISYTYQPGSPEELASQIRKVAENGFNGAITDILRERAQTIFDLDIIENELLKIFISE